MPAFFSSLLQSRSGSAAVEMALVTPLMLALMFGSVELGNYFLDSHIVNKAVRDGARFAARSLPLNTNCSTLTIPTDVRDKTRNITRTAMVGSGGSARLPNWTDGGSITVSVACNTSTTLTGKGIYTSMTGGAPYVTVSASLPYSSLFSVAGFADASGLTLHAQSQAAVTGI